MTSGSKPGGIKVIKYGTVIQVSRADLLDAGAVEPTDEERATLVATALGLPVPPHLVD